MKRSYRLEASLVIIAIAGGLLLLAGSPFVIFFATALFLSCPIAMLVFATGMRRHGGRGNAA